MTGPVLSASFRGPLSPALEVVLEALRTTRFGHGKVKCRRPTTKHGEEGKLLGIQLQIMAPSRLKMPLAAPQNLPSLWPRSFGQLASLPPNG